MVGVAAAEGLDCRCDAAFRAALSMSSGRSAQFGGPILKLLGGIGDDGPVAWATDLELPLRDDAALGWQAEVTLGDVEALPAPPHWRGTPSAPRDRRPSAMECVGLGAWGGLTGCD